MREHRQDEACGLELQQDMRRYMSCCECRRRTSLQPSSVDCGSLAMCRASCRWKSGEKPAPSIFDTLSLYVDQTKSD